MEIINTGHSEKFLELLNASRKSVTLVSPFIKKSKASQISMSLSSDIKLKILTTFDFSTMLQQASDPEAITVFKENFSNLDIKVKERLHAKVYIFDGEKALITSANLTFSGFESNIEYGVLINEEPHLGLIINDIEMLFSNAIRFEKILNENGLGTKILPEAIDWHYGGVWSHILPNFEQYKDIDLEKKYKATGDLLRRSICLNIPVMLEETEIKRLIETIKQATSSRTTV